LRMGAAAHLQYNFDGASNGARRPRTIPDAPTQPPLLLSSLPFMALSSRVRRMPLSARTCDWVIARPAERVRPMANLHTTAAAAITAFGGLSTACHGRPSEVRRACEKSNRHTRACPATAARAAHRSRRCLRAAAAHIPWHARPNLPRPRCARSRARRRGAASKPPTWPPSGAPGELQRPLRRSRAATGARRRPGTSTACAGV
jgi:hypothetical protein